MGHSPTPCFLPFFLPLSLPPSLHPSLEISSVADITGVILIVYTDEEKQNILHLGEIKVDKIQDRPLCAAYLQ